MEAQDAQGSLKRKAEGSPSCSEEKNGAAMVEDTISVSEEDMSTVLRVLTAFGQDIKQLHRFVRVNENLRVIPDSFLSGRSSNPYEKPFILF